MNTLLFNCPNCNHEMRLPASMVGQKGKCPSCAEVIIPLPALGSLTEEAPAPLPVQTRVEPIPPQPVATEDVPLEMGNMHFAEKNLASGEYIIHAGRIHPRLKKFLIGIFIGITLIQFGFVAFFCVQNAADTDPYKEAWQGRTVQDILIGGVSLIGVFSTGLFLILRYIYAIHSNIELVLTNKRLLSKRGIFITKTRDVQLESVGSIDFRLGLMERYWFNCGRITVRNTGGVKVGFFPFLADALEFRRRILAQIDRVQT